jgi:predicted CXXCH cytochrome family protein
MCLICHGDRVPYKLLNKNLPRGFALPDAQLKNIETEFRKNYRHPTFDARGIHLANEKLPETDPRMPRHADCVDCHNPHALTSTNKFAGIRGKSVGNLSGDVTMEYELCYRCHAESANLSGRYTNKKAEFSVGNPSFHPVEAEGKNSAVVSLIRPYKEKKIIPGDISTITCGDCHASEDPQAPRGPHGSRFEHILVENYSTRDNTPESSYVYALCYRCHSRTSILGNESFPYHSKHIVGATGALVNGTSCFTCHSAHGSTENKYLIRFNTDVVSPNSHGQLKFVEKGVAKFSGECYLTCHGVEHNPKKY